MMGFGNMDIHVAELFMTTNIGDSISILAEQLLVTSPMGDTIGQDHGFVYAIFSNIPLLPENISLKMGRTRFRYGIDAKLDSPANTLRSPVYKSIGMITDKGVELSGYAGSFEWSLGIMNGADTLTKTVTTTDGGTATITTANRISSKPVVARASIEATDSILIGASAYTGKGYSVLSTQGFGRDMIFNGAWDRSKLVYKNRAAFDILYKASAKWQFAGEYGMGRDIDNGSNFDISTYFIRSDYQIIPQKLALQLQYEFYDDGRPETSLANIDTGNLGIGLQYHITQQSWLRGSWTQDDIGLFRDGNGRKSEYIAILQTFLAF